MCLIIRPQTSSDSATSAASQDTAGTITPQTASVANRRQASICLGRRSRWLSRHMALESLIMRAPKMQYQTFSQAGLLSRAGLLEQSYRKWLLCSLPTGNRVDIASIYSFCIIANLVSKLLLRNLSTISSPSCLLYHPSAQAW